MNPQKSKSKKKEKLQEQQDIKNAINDYQGVEMNNDALNESSSVFMNSKTVPEALVRAAKNIPKGFIRSLVWKYIKAVNSILSKTLFYMGVELGASNDDIKGQAKDALKNIQTLTEIANAVLNDPEVKESIKQLAIALNSAVLRPFFNAALVTLEEMQPQVEIASNNLAGRVHNGVRKVTDAVGNGVLDGLGTVPYIGNVLAATGTIVNVLLGVQSIIDEASGAVLDQTMQTLVIIQKLAGPGNKAVNSWVNFALNANTVLKNFKNQWDKVSASFKGKEFTPDPLMTKEEILSKMDQKMSQDNPQQPNQKDDISTPDSIKPDSTELDKPNQPTSTANPQQKAAKKPGKKPVKKGGRRKNNTKKKNQKKRTKRKSRRRK